VREDLNKWERDGLVSFVGEDRPRWAAVTRTEAEAALAHLVEHRLPAFGPHKDAMLSADPWTVSSSVSFRGAPGSRGRA